MIMEVRWHLGKTLEQNNMEIANIALKLALGDKLRAATSIGIEVPELERLLSQMEKDQQVQKNAQARYDAQRRLAQARLTAPVQSHQHVQWNEGPTEPDQGIQAVGQTPMEPRTESGMSNKLGQSSAARTTSAPSAAAKKPTKAHSKRGALA